jgi:hypothetical protein
VATELQPKGISHSFQCRRLYQLFLEEAKQSLKLE